MAQIWKDRVQQTVTGTPGTGAFTLSTAVAGFQALAAGDDGNTGFFWAIEGTAWESFWGTYTHSGTSLARTSRKDSSTGSAISFTSAAVVSLDIIGQSAQAMMLASSGVTPGGRLTLTSATPVTTSDVTAAATIYYTPYIHNIICLWDGNIWVPTVFSEVSLALGTITSALPYDVFGFLSSGALSTELLAWTNGTTRATALAITDGRNTKSGDKTRLYLGTFYTTSTTTTEDSGGGAITQAGGKRFLWNAYNRVRRFIAVKDTADWAYSSATIRQANAATGNKVEYCCGLSVEAVNATLFAAAEIKSSTLAGSVGIGINSLTAYSGLFADVYSAAASFIDLFYSPSYSGNPGIGYNYIAWLERGFSATSSAFLGSNAGSSQSGLRVEVFA